MQTGRVVAKMALLAIDAIYVDGRAFNRTGEKTKD
jgi:hypothetical protein